MVSSAFSEDPDGSKLILLKENFRVVNLRFLMRYVFSAPHGPEREEIGDILYDKTHAGSG